MESLWVRYGRHADPDFLIDIRRDFVSRFWEMYLACSLEDLGYSITCRKPGPDILLTYGGKRVWIEAVAPSNGEDGTPDRVPDYRTNEVTSQPDNEILLRIRSAIEDKLKKYRSYQEKGLVSADDAWIVAVNASKIRYIHHPQGTSYGVQAVYPVGYPQLKLDIETKKVVDRSFTYRGDVRKATGTSIATDIFLQEHYRSLSAILYSTAAPFYPFDRTGDDYVLVHNLKASVPVPLGLVRRGLEHVASEDDEGITVTVAANWNEEGQT